MYKIVLDESALEGAAEELSAALAPFIGLTVELPFPILGRHMADWWEAYYGKGSEGIHASLVNREWRGALVLARYGNIAIPGIPEPDITPDAENVPYVVVAYVGAVVNQIIEPMITLKKTLETSSNGLKKGG